MRDFALSRVIRKNGDPAMAFRSDEAAASGYEKAKNYLIPRKFTLEQREHSERILQDVLKSCGPPVDSYPSWHPLVAQHDGRQPETYPNERCGYRGLDHTRCFAHGFITCPYGDGRDIIESVGEIDCNPCASVTAEVLDAVFYSEGTTPILVRCEWMKEDLEPNHTIPKSLAVPLMLEQELPVWRWADRAETWETMRPYLLGEPHGNRSSLFVTQDTALAMKKIYLAMVETGMFGPLKSG
ncbi:hypothetical protein [Azospirillum doebereinerae]